MSHTTDFDIACQRLNRLASDRRTPQAVSGDLSLVLLTASKVAWIEKEVERRGEEIIRLRAAIILHRSQRADDRCIDDDDNLYEALGDGIKCDRRVGDKDAMLANCRRFIERRCDAGGPWKSYAELESENQGLRQRVEQLERMVAGLERGAGRGSST